MDKIIIKGAREHNLKNIDLEIPRDSFVVITGVSGSGKSSLAFDTIYAEGQRRYVESLSAYARQFLEQMEKPDVDSIEGLSPAISIEQKSTSKNPRSTVGTATEIYDFMRLLFTRVGKPYCYSCGKEITSQTIQQMVERIMAFPGGSRIFILSPLVRGRKGEYKKELYQLRKEGFLRVRIDGEWKELDEDIALDKNKRHYIDVVVDRLIVKESMSGRLADSLETATKVSQGLVKVIVRKSNNRPEVKGPVVIPIHSGEELSLGKNDGEGTEGIDTEEFLFNEKLSCVECGISYPEITPRMFSFNSPHGACADCKGLGKKVYFDLDLIVPDKNMSLREGAIVPWEKKNSIYFHQMLDALSKHYDFDINAPFKDLSPAVQDVLLNGSKDEEISFYYDYNSRRNFYKKPFEGVLENLSKRYHEVDSISAREELGKFMCEKRCPACSGSRLKERSLFIKVHGLSIYDIARKSIRDSLDFFQSLKFKGHEADVAYRILKEIIERLSFLMNVGLDYLTLDRASATLAGGEGQRIRLATQLGSGLVGVLYVLDEPSIGLHQRDNLRLLKALKRLKDLGNSVLVVEHDEETICSADYVIDMGPAAGIHGGEIVASGPPAAIIANKNSITGKYLKGELEIPVPEKRRKPKGHYLTLKGARANNLKNLTVKIPLGLFTCVTGVSGSGKSTLVVDTLYKGVAERLYRTRKSPALIDKIEGIEHIDKVIDIDQSPIGRTPRSNPATYTGMFTYVRTLFAQLPEAKVRGYKTGRFSFNVKGGRCETCKGDGTIRIEMHFLPDVHVLCDVCKGKRYNRECLEIRYKGKNIAEVLDMTVAQALEYFKNIPSIKIKLTTLYNVGLGYIKLGQSATTLSGGEAQRIKLAKELSKKGTGKTLYILDEPTTGLHFADIQKLLDVLNDITDAGNTVVVIEHNMEVIKSADWIIDLGPEGGEEGGKIIATGTPEKVARSDVSSTGSFLKKYCGGPSCDSELIVADVNV
ncbi:MAG: excinuclease ABC subunit UvrA [Thermodesulfobacteriota bacterium]